MIAQKQKKNCICYIPWINLSPAYTSWENREEQEKKIMIVVKWSSWKFINIFIIFVPTHLKQDINKIEKVRRNATKIIPEI